MNATQGTSLIGFGRAHAGQRTFNAVNPATGEKLSPAYHVASREDIDAACALAQDAFPTFSRLPGRKRAEFLRAIANRIEAIGSTLVETAMRETALPSPRLQGETARTCGQLRLFAQVLDEGSWVQARIDSADPNRKPAAKPDIRSMYRPLGPVVVFGASNFPLAFSVAGGDTASAFAAGNPVIVKAHPAHPATSEFVGQAIVEAVRDCGLPEGVFSLIFDDGIDAGAALVQHRLVRAVGFTGSTRGGRALMDLAAARPDPIPVYAEMGSTNPVFVLPGAVRERGQQIAEGLHTSVTMGAGQFCTKPGLVMLGTDDTTQEVVERLRDLVSSSPEWVLLTSGIRLTFCAGVDARTKSSGSTLLAQGTSDPQAPGHRVATALFETNPANLQADTHLAEELFGPSTLLVRYSSRDELLQLARDLEGHLTATVHATEQDLRDFAELFAILETKVGRVILNGYPTGVEVAHAMVHGGPYPATSDGRSTSVGTQAIYRFARLVCYQGFVDSLLPDELKDSNPLGIWRMVDGSQTRDVVRR
ncbi:MAG TPA: aldehyde dehydrogenase (NADP(+)) [Terriglobales bacterium]|nr:aldehyde dehydrogenase (NADP(+)) [Terriglobales bacterium]